MLCCLTSSAQVEEYKESQKANSKTFLIVDSYSELSPWSKTVIRPITYYMANNDNVHAELYHLNSVLINNEDEYQKVFNEFFTRFGNKKIDYVAFIGQLAFTFRDEAKRRWGDDVPMLLITRDITVTDTRYYFSVDTIPKGCAPPRPIADLRGDYNLTAIYVPNYNRETIDMMNSMLGGMDKLVLFVDGAYYNRTIASDTETYLAENYPEVDFELVRANADDNYALQYYLTHNEKHTGLLMSSWFYEKDGPLGHPILVSGDLNLISSSVNPIFALRQAFMNFGAIGGVYFEPSVLSDKIMTVVEQMVNDVQPRTIKLSSDDDHPVCMIDYPQLKEYELSESNCPEDTVFVNKPLSFWQKYSWRIITAILLIAVILFLMARHNMAQRHEIEILQRDQKFIDNMPVPYSKARILYTPDMKVANIEYTLYNQAFADLLKENGARGKTYILFPNDFIAQKTTEMLKDGRPVKFMHHFTNSDRYIVFTLCIVTASRKNSVEVVDSIDIFANDITDRQKNERKLRETSQRLDLTINIANIIPWEWDMKSDIMYMKAPEIFKRRDNTYSSDPEKEQWSAVPTAEYMRMLVSEDKEEMRHVREQLILDKISQFHIEYRIKVNRQGKEVIEWFDVSGAVSERDDAGKPSRVIGTLIVVTDRKRQENELIEAEEKARDSDRKKSAFLANMSHEIRTPLNAIVGFSNLMAETDDPAKRKEYADLINMNNNMLLNLVNDVLDLSKIESNTLDINKTATDLNDLMLSAGRSMNERVKPGVELRMVNGSPHCYVNIDANRIMQVMLNLLNNASKFTDTGSITYGYDRLGANKIHFYVKDTGAGVSPQNQERLFKRFDRLNSKVHGTGLGLSICKHLIEHMGGEIGMESKGEGKGATFWFNMPYEPVDESLVQSYAPPVPETPVPPAPQSVTAPEKHGNTFDTENRPYILIAEDIEGNYLLLKSFLSKNFTLEHAWDGSEAVEMFSRRRPDLILMDISMPKLNGYQATEKIRQMDPDIPIIAVTAYAYATDRKRILSSGFNDYVAKPISRAELNKAIERHLDMG